MQTSRKSWFSSPWTLGFLFLGVACTGSFYFPSVSSLSKETEQASLITAQTILPSMSSAQLPLYFERNEGQVDPTVKFLSRGQGYTFYFTPEEVVMVLKQTSKEVNSLAAATLRIQFAGADKNPTITGLQEQECKTHYFKGSDSQQWRTDISNFAKVNYESIYPGIDAVFYGDKAKFEYDFCVAPGANPQDARLHIEGVKELSIDQSGNLSMRIEDGREVQMLKPVVYQMVEGEKVFVEGGFELLAHHDVGFALGAYDPNRPLIIDPVLYYSTFLGGNSFDAGNGIAVDSDGNAYIVGQTASINFPTKNALQPALGGSADFFIAKLNSAGSALIYSTYLGGSGNDAGLAIALDDSRNAYVVGNTTSLNFPITLGAFQSLYPGGFTSGVITKINSTGSALIYSTYLGGSGRNNTNETVSIAVDSSGNAYVTGDTQSPDFPLMNPIQPTLGGVANAFVTKINSTGTALVYSTYLGGSSFDNGSGIAIDNSGNAYVTGRAGSSDFPTTTGAVQTIFGGIIDAFITKIDPTGSALVYSTYLGGTDFDGGNSIAIDSSGNAYVTGSTNSTDFPTTAGAFQTVFRGGSTDAFITKIDPTGSTLIYSTYLGGTDFDTGNSIVIDSSGNAYVAGTTNSTDFPLVNPLQPSGAVFLSKMDSAGSELLFSTHLGGSSGADQGKAVALDSFDNPCVTGATQSSDFPTTQGAFQRTFGGLVDAFVVKVVFTFPPPLPPVDLKGAQVANKFLTQTDFVNILSWNAPIPLLGNPPIAYKVFRNAALTELAGIVQGKTLKFLDHDRKKGKTYTYWVVSLDGSGNESLPAVVVVHPVH